MGQVLGHYQVHGMFGSERLPGQSTERDSSNVSFYHSLMCSTFSIDLSMSATPALQPRQRSAPGVFYGRLGVLYAGKLHRYLSSVRWASCMLDLYPIGLPARWKTHEEKQDQ